MFRAVLLLNDHGIVGDFDNLAFQHQRYLLPFEIVPEEGRIRQRYCFRGDYIVQRLHDDGVFAVQFQFVRDLRSRQSAAYNDYVVADFPSVKEFHRFYGFFYAGNVRFLGFGSGSDYDLVGVEFRYIFNFGIEFYFYSVNWNTRCCNSNMY